MHNFEHWRYIPNIFSVIFIYVNKFRVNIQIEFFVLNLLWSEIGYIFALFFFFTFLLLPIEFNNKKKLIKSTPHPIQFNRKEYLIAKAFNKTTSHANHVERSMDAYLSRLLFKIVINRISGSRVHYLKFSVDCLNEIILKFSNNIRIHCTYSLLYHLCTTTLRE